MKRYCIGLCVSGSALFLSLILLAGCSSIDGKYVGTNLQKGENVGGLPIVVQAPKWIKVTYKKVTYGVAKTVKKTESSTAAKPAVPGLASADLAEDAANPAPEGKDKKDAPAKPVKEVKTPDKIVTETSEMVAQEPVTLIETEIINQGKVFSIDTLRPAAGTSDASIEFADNSQYPKKVANKTDDKTIAAMTEAIEAMAKTAAGAFTAGSASVPANATILTQEITKIELYDLETLKIVQTFPNSGH